MNPDHESDHECQRAAGSEHPLRSCRTSLRLHLCDPYVRDGSIVNQTLPFSILWTLTNNLASAQGNTNRTPYKL